MATTTTQDARKILAVVRDDAERLRGAVGDVLMREGNLSAQIAEANRLAALITANLAIVATLEA